MKDKEIKLDYGHDTVTRVFDLLVVFNIIYHIDVDHRLSEIICVSLLSPNKDVTTNTLFNYYSIKYIKSIQMDGSTLNLGPVSLWKKQWTDDFFTDDPNEYILT